ncbi:hypothetical protein ACE939_04065 [Aquimarina sp. W85]|uniref:hypothetical protein n=1 Tax=Aquimarina rhodophyticola TaxID=3342246 RepID=UPI00366DCA35
MNQKRFSELIKSFLVEKFPEFTKTINYKDDNSFGCDLRNPTNEFSIWIATYNSEITIGLEDPSGKTDIHTHISCYKEEDINNALTDLATEINNITKGKTFLYHSDGIGYQLTNDINLILKRKNTFENIRVYNWNVN